MSKQCIAIFVVVAVIAAAVDSSAFAQRGRGGFMGRGGGGSMRILGNEAVQKELEMVDDQIEEVKKLEEKLREEFPRPDFGNFREMSEEERGKVMAQMRERGEKMEKAAQKKIADILLPHQVARLKEITVQQMGAGAVLNAEVAAKLNLTDKQKTKIESVRDESMTEMREKIGALFRGGNREEAMAKMAEMRKEFEQKMLAPLTDAQKKQFEEMKGKPFEMPRRQSGRGGGEGRQRGRRPE